MDAAAITVGLVLLALFAGTFIAWSLCRIAQWGDRHIAECLGAPDIPVSRETPDRLLARAAQTLAADRRQALRSLEEIARTMVSEFTEPPFEVRFFRTLPQPDQHCAHLYRNGVLLAHVYWDDGLWGVENFTYTGDTQIAGRFRSGLVAVRFMWISRHSFSAINR